MAMLSSPLVLIQSVPPVTRAFTAATLVTSALYGWCWWRGVGPDAAFYTTLIPGSLIYAPWTLLTSALVETTIWELLATLIFVPPSLKYLERVWGSVETIKFIVVTVVLSNVIAFGLNWIEYFVLGNAELFLGMRYHGQMALQIGLLVAFTQLIPEHNVQLMGVIKVKVKTLPMAYLTLSTVLCIVGLQNPWILIQFGWFVSWVYLRFYKKNTVDSINGVTYGDRSDTFSLISWFPPFMHTPLTYLGNTVFSLANKFHLIPTTSSDIEGGSYSQLPGGARAEAERRRAMALKALDQRVASTSSPVGSSSTNGLRGAQPAALARAESSSSQASSSAAGGSLGGKSVEDVTKA
ncbi:eukaryotic integral membrane protein-domain-containing protein [Ephemerocybe angulata]|uniref:Eukaryotic integral membrane protein-domain-containing protein n=1 Tax=Ephemerocybe angulata TaxID=980116 RepID=A0A8H6IKX9_9AGAR|nr:eukaryotic integral membrane protein-domain-containing protein [Tulosesus angulatus]